MNVNHKNALDKHNEDELRPRIVPLEHWKQKSNRVNEKLYPGYIFDDKI